MKLVPLSRGLYAKVDDDDFDVLIKFRWFAIPQQKPNCLIIYAARAVYNPKTQKQRLQGMHAFLMGGLADHRDGNGLNNQRSNLRVCSNEQNQRNRRKMKIGTSRWKGVSKAHNSKKWMVIVQRKYAGKFSDEADAALAYNLRAEELYGEWACFNTP